MKGWFFKKKTYSLFLILPLLLAPFNLISSVAVNKLPAVNSSELSESVKKRIWVINQNREPSNPWAFLFEDSVIYGLIVDGRSYNNISPTLIRYRAFGRSEIKTEVKQINGQQEIVNKVITPAYQTLILDAVSKVFVTGFDGKIRVFDSDDYELPSLPTEGFIPPVISTISQNPRSINSNHFKDALLGARKISFAIKEDVFWVTQKGARTKYKLVPRDFLFSFIRTYSTTADFRHKNGGSKQIDQWWLKKTNGYRFRTSASYTDEYILNFFNIDTKALLDLDGKSKKKPLEKIRYKGRVYDVLSFNLIESVKSKTDPSIQNFFFRQILGTSLFIPVPSDFIIEQATKRKQPYDGTGLIKRIGYYWYGEHLEDTLFSGPYIPYHYIYNAVQEVVSYKKNPFYHDQNFIKDVNRVEEFVVRASKREPTVFYQSNYADFVQGKLANVPTDNISSDDFNAILSGRDGNISKDKISFTIPFNVYQVGTRFNFISFPGESIGPNGLPNPEVYRFNDVFAKFMYGASRDELARGTAKIAKRFFGDEAISFRSIINAAINWDKVYNQISNGNSLYSLTLSPPNGRFQGSDKDSSKYQTPIDAKEFINDAFVVKDGRKVLTIKHIDNLINLNNPKESESLLGGGVDNFAKLQVLMTDLLDKFYQENNFSDSEKMDIPWAFNLDSRIERIDFAAIEVLKTLNSLDKKARLNFHYVALKDSNDRYNFFYNGFSAFTSKNWVNNFEGNGATLNAFLAVQPFYVVFLPIFAKRSEADSNNPFPLLTRLAKLFEAGVKEGKYRFVVPFQDWVNLTNQELFASYDIFKDTELPNPDTEIARFLYQAQDKFSNEEHARLNVELAVLMGPKFNHLAVIKNYNRGVAEIYQRGVFAPRTAFGISHIEDIIFNPILAEDKN